MICFGSGILNASFTQDKSRPQSTISEAIEKVMKKHLDSGTTEVTLSIICTPLDSDEQIDLPPVCVTFPPLP